LNLLKTCKIGKLLKNGRNHQTGGSMYGGGIL